MTSQTPSPAELMRLHVRALFTHDDRSRIKALNQWDGGEAPRFFLGRTKTGNLWRFRADQPDTLVAKLEALCREEPLPDDPKQAPAHWDAYLRELAFHAPIRRIWTGPAYAFTTDVVPDVSPEAISRENQDLLRGEMEEWLKDVPHRQPLMAMIVEGRAVSVCASVRITRPAHEAGVETLPEHRRRGHAANTVAGWATAVRKIGALPLYSTSWENTGSMSVAEKLGLFLFGADFHVT
jgi:hypothetical protein